MSQGRSWLTFGILCVVTGLLYLLGVFAYLPLIGEQFTTGPVIARIVILLNLVLTGLVVVRVVVGLQELKAEREAIDEASLLVDRPAADTDFAALLAELPRDGLLASRVDVLTTYLDGQTSTEEVCLLLARQSGMDNDYGELVFGADLAILGLMNIAGTAGAIVLLTDVVSGMVTAVSQDGQARMQVVSTLLPLMNAVLVIGLVTTVLAMLGRLLIRILQRRQRIAIITADELALHLASRAKPSEVRSPTLASPVVNDDPFAGRDLSDMVERAFGMSAQQADPDSPIQTAALLVMLARADAGGRWDRIELNVGELTRLPSHFYLDPEPSAERLGARRNGLLLSDTLTDALTLCGRICVTYDMEIVHPGVVTLALLGNPRSGASRCLLRFTDLTHKELLEQVQEDLVGQPLDGVGRLIARHVLDEQGAGRR